ncbi:MAG: Uma2 family endonuclease [Cytophagales bacterium]|nr:Uma2 family endonuclease [Cytophagales bacterium]
MENQIVGVEVTQPGADFDLTQIVNGEEIIMPSPVRVHQKISARLTNRLFNFVENNNLGEVYSAPFDVILDKANRVQPDILFVRQDRLSIIGDFVKGAPDLVIEIVSPSSFELDTVKKRELYARFGVPEYWIVTPEQKSIEVFSLEGGTYKLNNFALESGTVTSPLLPGFSVDLQNIFEG